MNIPSSSPARNRILIGLDWLLRGIGALSVVLILYVIFVSISFHDVTPPRDMFTISAFRKWRPDLTDAAEVSVRGAIYYVVKGPYAHPIPSDHSEFYFDASGNYLTWNSDVGDSGVPGILHPSNTTRKSIPITAIPGSN